ncbi:hypothetical protein ACWERF_05220 [Streptomyces griseoluteus]
MDDHVVYAGDTGDPLQVVQGALVVTHRGGVLPEGWSSVVPSLSMRTPKNRSPSLSPLIGEYFSIDP